MASAITCSGGKRPGGFSGQRQIPGNGSVVMSEQKQHTRAAPSITPRTIREFAAPAALRGCDRDSVDQFLPDVAASHGHALNDVVRLERRVVELGTLPDETLPPWADGVGGDGATSTQALRRELEAY